MFEMGTNKHFSLGEIESAIYILFSIYISNILEFQIEAVNVRISLLNLQYRARLLYSSYQCRSESEEINKEATANKYMIGMGSNVQPFKCHTCKYFS